MDTEKSSLQRKNTEQNITKSTQTQPRRMQSTKGDRLGKALTFIMGSIILGYFGGWLAVKNSSNVIDSSSAATRQVILQESELIADVVERVGPSVVSINVTTDAVSESIFFGPQSFESQGEGSGIILSEDGLVVTNKHVIPESVSSVSVIMYDGTVYDEVEIVGRDSFNDIAFLKIKNGDNLQAAELGDSSQTRVGDKVIAIGNALGQFENTVTSGIISGQGRPIVAGSGFDAEQLQNLLQTDTAINPGNSGGPLVNIHGEVIGINTAVSGEGQNIGFSIPINDVKPGIVSIDTTGELIRPYLGVRYILLTKEIAEDLDIRVEDGAYISSSSTASAILDDSPAQKAGLQENDVIIKINDIAISEKNPLVTAVSQFQVGDTILLTVQRGSEQIELQVLLEEVPDSL